MIEFIKSLKFRIGLSERDRKLSYQKRHQEQTKGQTALASLLAPDSSRVWGFDCSHWSGLVDMAKAVANGASFVIIKGKDGTVTSNYFVKNYASAKAAGIIRGAYCWLYPSDKISVTTQVNSWWNLVKDDLPDLPIVIDFEWTYYGGYPANPTINDLRAAVNGIFSLSGRKPIVYTSAGYIGTVGAIPQDIIENTSGVWTAHYGVSNPLIPKNYTSYILHQWTDQMDGSIVGYDPAMSKAADGNYWNGDLQSLKDFAGIGTEPVPTNEIWLGSVLRKIPVYKKPSLDPPAVTGLRKKGASVKGPLVTTKDSADNDILFVKIRSEPDRYVPVREKDTSGNLIWKYIKLTPEEPPAPQQQLYRVLHDYERWERGLLEPDQNWDWRAGLPEVFPLSDSVILADRNVQQLMWDLFRAGAPSVDENTAKGKWRSLYQYDRAFMNNNGFNDDNDPRCDYIGGNDLDSPLPKFDKVRVCGGATVSGWVRGDELVLHVINAADPNQLKIDYVLERPWLYFHATTSRNNGGQPAIGRFPQGLGEPCFIPLISKVEVAIPLSHLELVSDIADPYKL